MGAVDVNNGASKENLHFDDQINNLLFFLSSQCFVKELENMFSVFLSSYKHS